MLLDWLELANSPSGADDQSLCQIREGADARGQDGSI
jgi:hypothetical protein